VTTFQYGAAAQVYVIANVVILLGYLFVPILVLPHLELRRRTMIAMTVFFLGCVGSHADMVVDVLAGHLVHPVVGWVAVWWHTIQAIGTWAAILFFRAELREANALLAQIEGSEP
jgi:hypothetical protein